MSPRHEKNSTSSLWSLLSVGALTNGIGGVSDDDIEAVDLVLEESESVANVDLDLGVLKSSSHRGQVLLGNADNSLT